MHTDEKDRLIVKDFIKKAWGKRSTNNLDPYGIDLICEDWSKIEIESMKLSTYQNSKEDGEINIVRKKYFKYFSDPANKNFMVFVFYDDDAKRIMSGTGLLIDGKYICQNTNTSVTKTYPSSDTDKGYTEVCPCAYDPLYVKEIAFDKKLVDELNGSPTVKENVVLDIVKVNEATRMMYWKKFQNYSVSRRLLNKEDGIIRFVDYSPIPPFKETGKFIEMPIEDLKSLPGQIRGDYYLVKREDIIKNGKIV